MIYYRYMSTIIYDLGILGGGPAGCSAAVYAARKKLTTALITDSFGGQSIVSETIYNWIGTPEISGSDLAANLEQHVRAYPDDVSVFLSKIESISFEKNIYTIQTISGESIQCRTILYTLGSSRRQLNAINADKFEHRGLTYCASCDGPVFTDQDVVVVGGGNAAFESALQLLAYCKSVTLLHRSDQFRADEISVTAAMKNPKFKAVTNASIQEIMGDKLVSGVRYTTPTGEVSLPCAGVFVEIGQIPNTDLLRTLAKKLDVDFDESTHIEPRLINSFGQIITDPKTGRTALARLWAAGDCTDCLYHQNNIAAGDGVRALEDMYIWIKQNAN